MLKILFLDDDEGRQAFMRRELVGHKATHVTTARQAIDELERNDDYDIVFLDHDLGGEVFVDSGREDTGMEVVRWLAQNPRNIGRVVVHTLNPPARENMVCLLERSGYRAEAHPFLLLRTTIGGLLNACVG